MEFNYECGTFQTSPDTDSQSKTVYFDRVLDILKTLTELCTSGDLHCPVNVPPSELKLLVTGDKGGPSTKIYSQTLNVKSTHSHNGEAHRNI